MAYHRRLYDALHVDGIDVEDAAVLADYVRDIVEYEDFLAALRSGRYAAQQAEGNDYAYEKNDVWFLPAFRMDGRKLDAEGGVGVSKERLAEFISAV